MAEIAGRRMTAEIEGDFVVFLIGATLNSKLHLLRSFADLGGRRGMKYMLDYLVEHPEKGPARLRDGISRRSSSTGDPSSISRRSPRTRTIRTSRCGATTGAVSGAAAAPGSGTRRSSCGPASTRRSTATRGRAASARRGGSCRSPNPQARARGSAGGRPDAPQPTTQTLRRLERRFDRRPQLGGIGDDDVGARQFLGSERPSRDSEATQIVGASTRDVARGVADDDRLRTRIGPAPLAGAAPRDRRECAPVLVVRAEATDPGREYRSEAGATAACAGRHIRSCR